MQRTQFEALYLCLKAGNEVDLMPRSKAQKPIRIVRCSRVFEKEGIRATHGINVVVHTPDGQRIQLIAGDVLKQPQKNGYEWKI